MALANDAADGGGARPPHLRFYGPHDGSVKTETRPPKGSSYVLLGAIYTYIYIFTEEATVGEWGFKALAKHWFYSIKLVPF